MAISEEEHARMDALVAQRDEEIIRIKADRDKRLKAAELKARSALAYLKYGRYAAAEEELERLIKEI